MKKNEVRSQFRALRTGICEEEIDQSSRLIFQNLQPIITKYRVIHTFLPIKKNKEINTWMLIHEYLNNHKVVISKTDFTNHQMTHYLLTSDTEIVENHMGIPEPSNAEEFDVNQIEAVMVPMLAFDQVGNRVGYGKGYYDQFLGSLKPGVQKIGLCLFPPVDTIEADEHDISLDLAITPEQIFDFRKA